MSVKTRRKKGEVKVSKKTIESIHYHVEGISLSDLVDRGLLEKLRHSVPKLTLGAVAFMGPKQTGFLIGDMDPGKKAGSKLVIIDCQGPDGKETLEAISEAIKELARGKKR